MGKLQEGWILFANHASPNPVLVVPVFSYFVLLPVVVFTFLAGGFFRLLRATHPKRESTCDGVDNIVLIGKIVLGYLTGGLFIGYYILGKALIEAYRMIRENYGPSGEELLGKRRKRLLLAAVPAAGAVWCGACLLFAHGEDLPELASAAVEFAGYPYVLLIKLTNSLTDETGHIFPDLSVALLLCVLWLVIRLVMRFTPGNGESARTNATDGLAVFGYLLLGHFTLIFIVGIFFYIKAFWLAAEVLKAKYKKVSA